MPGAKMRTGEVIRVKTPAFSLLSVSAIRKTVTNPHHTKN